MGTAAAAPGGSSLGASGAPFGVVPVPGPGACTRCHGPARRGPGECWCCRQVGRALGQPLGAGPPVAVVALCRPGDALHALLRRYKDGPVAEARRHHAAVLGRLLDGFLAGPRGAPGAGPARTGPTRLDALIDLVVPVPSSSRPAPAATLACPLDAVLDASRRLGSLPRGRLARGPGPIGHLRASPDAFVAPACLAGRRVLVVEDTWVTGARARSAATAMGIAGATVVAVVAIGRAVDPAAAPDLADWWRRTAAGQES